MLKELMAGLALCLPLTAQAQSVSPAKPPVAAFGTVPTASNPAVSPDGNKLAVGVVRPDGGKDLMVLDLSGGKPLRIGLRDMRLEGLQFEEDGRLLAEASVYLNLLGAYQFTGWVTRTYSIKLPEGVIRVLLGREDAGDSLVSGADFVSQMDGQPGQVALQTYDRSASRPTWDLFRASLTGGPPFTLGRGNLNTASWGVDLTGAPVARVDYDLQARRTTLFIRQDEEWNPALTDDDEPSPSINVLGPLDASGILIRRTGRARTGAYERVDTKTGAVTTAVRGEDVPLQSAWLDPWTSAVAGISFGGVNPDVAWLDPELAGIENMLREALKGPARIQSYSRDRKVFAVLVESATQPPVLYVYDDRDKKVREVTRGMPGLEGFRPGERRVEIVPRGRGGDFPVTYTLPPGDTPAGGWPALVVVRSNILEENSDTSASFDWLAQFLASRGIVAIEPGRPRVRGDSPPLTESTYAEWGPTARDRVNAALTFARTKGWTSGRACALGQSFRFLTALESAMRPENGITCIVGIDGVADLGLAYDAYRRSTSSDEGRQTDFGFSYFKSQFGENRDVLSAASPIRRAAEAPQHVLLFSNRTDRGSEFGQARETAAALQRAGKSVQRVTLENGDRSFSRTDVRTEFLTKLESFLTAQFSPTEPAATAAK